MADYKRLVSYMYNYENRMKRNNIGYSRVEVRNGQCKITISIKALSFNNMSLRAYIFKHKGGKNKCYGLGDVVIRNGNGDLKLITDAKNIANSGNGLDDMAGIVVYYTPDKFFATEWDDNPIVAFDLDEDWKKEKISKEESLEESSKEVILEEGLFDKKSPEERLDEITNKDDMSEDQKRQTDLGNYSNKENSNDFEEEKVAEKEEFIRDRKESKTENKVEERTFDSNDKKEINEDEYDLKNKVTEEQDEKDEYDENIEDYRIEFASQVERPNKEKREKRTNPFTTNHIIDNLMDEIKLSKEHTKNKVDSTKNTLENVINHAKQSEDESAITDSKVDTAKENQKVHNNINSNIKELIENLTNIIDKKTSDTEDITKSNLSSWDDNNNTSNALQNELGVSSREIGNPIENDNISLYPIDYDFFDYYGKNEKVEDIEDMELTENEESKESKIFKSYAKLNPFEDKDIIDCVKIEPQDIGIFPMEFWVLGNNSFLLHSYYNYRHLLFAKRSKEKDMEYLLGVPGIYENKEKFIANMFGFYDFKGVASRKPKNGDFGYWLLEIKM